MKLLFVALAFASVGVGRCQDLSPANITTTLAQIVTALATTNVTALLGPYETTPTAGQDPAKTCRANFLLQNTGCGFNGCLFGTSNNLFSDTNVLLLNTIWAPQGFGAANWTCYCNSNCQPSQIVCEGNNGGNLLLSQGVYLAEFWNFYCYCPQWQTEAEACAKVQPKFCDPVPGGPTYGNGPYGTCDASYNTPGPIVNLDTIPVLPAVPNLG